MDIYKLETVDDLWNHIAYVLLYAPNQFPVEDFLTDTQQMNLERAFAIMRQGIEIAYPNNSHPEKSNLLNQILNSSYALYIARDEIKAAQLLNEFEDNIFKKNIGRTLQ